ncbi:hypothetical protein PFICI_04754 [Pestalotiopsis fici W106-1]|uniref:Alginate lyase 2 domain-containing protein n=1 Tax=Pestalotiopsis fici (strain W106-1 / CGMCC3.15140) TaxID=1229662 RepID=W3X9U1_PESFW|nr:uncharacterized protein PFICI_04754 [Pestalotiopsis fici W106-1]ETS82878.1 hypothetical protein PFICI_04754 [Pestalotiopsis fici W106-1]
MLATAATLLFASSFATAWSGPANTTTLHASGWESGTVNPFSSCNVKSPSYISASSGSPLCAGSRKLTAYFDESDYDGTRDDRGAEICVKDASGSTNLVNMHSEGWQGFGLYVPSNGFPSDKATIIAQQFCPGGCSSWCGTLSIEDMGLYVDHRPACGDSTHATVTSSLSRDVWHDIVIHFKASHAQNGLYQVWLDGSLMYSATGINVGFGDSWTIDDTITNGFYFKNGMYAYDYDEYANATRQLYFDNLSWLAADGGMSDGYNIVDPAC